jgi:hypothetical protein
MGQRGENEFWLIVGGNKLLDFYKNSDTFFNMKLNNNRGNGGTEVFVTLFLIILFSLGAFTGGLIVSDDDWRKTIVARGLAEYTVDATTGKTTLVWKSDKTEAVASGKK